MASIRQVRGALLEEIILFLLSHSGYRVVKPGEEGTRRGRAGLEVEGRGASHQIDALVAPVHSHAFIYPIRLLVEAKCEERRVGLPTVRSVVGTLFDINQNYFSRRFRRGLEIRVQRFNYHAAMFSANGYTRGAQQYAAAHQVFLIGYTNVPMMRPVIDALMQLDSEDFLEGARARISDIRQLFRRVVERSDVGEIEEGFRDTGLRKIRDLLLPALAGIGGTYYGMIEGIYPIHLLARRPISGHLILERAGALPCRVRVSDDNRTWAFEPSRVDEASPDFFRLEFEIPTFIAEILNARTQERREDEPEPEWLTVANLKRDYLRFIDVTGMVDGRLTGFRLALDVGWLDDYVRRRRRRNVH